MIFDERRRGPLVSKEEDYGSSLRSSNNLATMEELSEKSIVDALKLRLVFKNSVFIPYVSIRKIEKIGALKTVLLPDARSFLQTFFFF